MTLLSLPPPGADAPLLFLDFEASSLSPESWPIEIGLAWVEAGEARMSATLIAPHPDWPLDDWADYAAAVHGLDLDAVRAGAPAGDVAAATDALAGFELVSDNPRWDQRWLDRLRGPSRPRLTIGRLRDAARARLNPYAADELAWRLLREPAPHRAGPDALRLARAWAAAERIGLAA
ncbi:hypothetical protein [Amaricoccus sp.]|uniref:3'-5' exonuclease n=1 Tax=Amaricoccus sp. TaxID=1872485 RepID=UPI001B6A5E6E|nr:hypothetical protein [Amaricoccus sp.]MBP7003685.1 hypothetical protein [Amaricoccus sp.]